MSTGEKCECTTKGSDGRHERWGKYPGPWQQEPDRLEFEHAGFPCLLHRGPGGHWCGYVAVPPGHPYHGLSYDAFELSEDPHGGLTYAAPCAGHICHVPKPGEPDNVWWFGFDCAHGGDYRPTDALYAAEYGGVFAKSTDDTYKTVEYVRKETERLAEQLVERAIELSKTPAREEE